MTEGIWREDEHEEIVDANRLSRKSSNASWTAVIAAVLGGVVAFKLVGLVESKPQTPSQGNTTWGELFPGHRMEVTRDDVRQVIREMEANVPEAIREMELLVPDTMREIEASMMQDAAKYGLSASEVREQMWQLEADTRRQIRDMEPAVRQQIREMEYDAWESLGR